MDRKQTIVSKQAEKHMDVLQGSILFEGLDRCEILAHLSGEGVSFKRYKARSKIFFPGMSAARLCILLEGGAHVSKRSGNKTLRMSELAPGAVLGTASLFAHENTRPYPTHVHAGADACLLEIAEPALLLMFQHDTRILRNYLRYITDRIYFLNARIDNLICPSAKDRLYLYLMQNANENKLKLDMTALAQALGISRATLYRALDSLEQTGVIRRRGKEIMLTGISPEIHKE